MSATTRANNRNTELLESAADLFSTVGYEAATMRNIADKCGMTPGSIYYHYPSKDLMLVAVYAEGVRRLKDALAQALEGVTNPQERLEKAIARHIELIVEKSAFPSVLIRVLPDAAPAVADDLIRLRRDYESIFKSILSELPFADGEDQSLIRLLMIGAINHVHWWYRSDGKTPAEIARQMVAMVIGRTR